MRTQSVLIPIAMFQENMIWESQVDRMLNPRSFVRDQRLAAETPRVIPSDLPSLP